MAKAESLTRSSGFIVPLRRGQSLEELRGELACGCLCVCVCVCVSFLVL